MKKKKNNSEIKNNNPKKKKNFLIGVLVILIIFLAGITILFISEKTKKTAIDDILNRIDNNEHFILAITDDSLSSQDMNLLINFYESAYNVKFTKYNLTNKNTSNIQKVLEKINMESAEIIAPTLIFIDDSITIISSITSEEDFKQYLIKFHYINEEEDEKIIDYEQFKSIFSGDEKELLLLSAYSEDATLARKELLDLKKKYSFHYNYINLGVGDSYFIENDLTEAAQHYILAPALVIVQNNQIVDYLEINEKSNLNDFLMKNNIITETSK